MKKYNFINSILVILVVTIVVVLVNFGSASTEVLGEALTAGNLIATVVFIIMWMWQSKVAGEARSRGFLYFTLGYWLLGMGLILLVDLSMRTGIMWMATAGAFGLLLVMIPTYAVIFVAAILHIDYMWCYPVILLLILLCYWLGTRKAAKLAAAAAAAELELTDAPVPEATDAPPAP